MNHIRPQTDLREAPVGNDHQGYYDRPTSDDTPMLLGQEPLANTTNGEVPQPRLNYIVEHLLLHLYIQGVPKLLSYSLGLF